MKRLGERIRRKREGLQLQLSDLAKQVGISSSALSQIENAKAFPSIFSLKAIADHLHTTVGELIGEYETLSQNPRIREAEKKFIKKNKSGTKLYLLSHHDPYKQMETYLVVLAPGGDAQDIMARHPGQEFLYILNGSMEILLEEKSYDLQKGDSFYFNSSMSHSVHNINKGNTEMLWVITPHM